MAVCLQSCGYGGSIVKQKYICQNVVNIIYADVKKKVIKIYLSTMLIFVDFVFLMSADRDDNMIFLL